MLYVIPSLLESNISN